MFLGSYTDRNMPEELYVSFTLQPIAAAARDKATVVQAKVKLSEPQNLENLIREAAIRLAQDGGG